MGPGFRRDDSDFWSAHIARELQSRLTEYFRACQRRDAGSEKRWSEKRQRRAI